MYLFIRINYLIKQGKGITPQSIKNSSTLFILQDMKEIKIPE